MLQLAHRTSAPRATKVSINTAVCTVMCSDPAILAPASGLESPYCARMAISPGISCSARVISLRPNSARVRSATRKSMSGSLWEPAALKRIHHIRGVSYPSQLPGRPSHTRAAPNNSVARSCGTFWPRSGHVLGVVDVRLEVKRSNHRLGSANIDLGQIDRRSHVGGSRLRTNRNLGGDQHLLWTKVQGLHVNDALDARRVGQRSPDPLHGLGTGRLTNQQALCLNRQRNRNCDEQQADHDGTDHIEDAVASQ